MAIEGNIGSGKTSLLKFFKKNSLVEVYFQKLSCFIIILNDYPVNYFFFYRGLKKIMLSLLRNFCPFEVHRKKIKQGIIIKTQKAMASDFKPKNPSTLDTMNV